MAGELQWSICLLVLAINGLGICVALRWLNRERPNIPFLI